MSIGSNVWMLFKERESRKNRKDRSVLIIYSYVCVNKNICMKAGTLFIHRVEKWIVWMGLIGCTLNLYAQNAVSKYRADSLKRVLSGLNDPGEKIPVLKELVGLHWQLPEETFYLKEIIRVAQEVDSSSVVYSAMSALSRYYYNCDKSDSLFYWSGQIDSLTRQKNEFPNALFLAHSLICHQYLWKGNYELAMDEAIRWLNQAKKENQIYGLVRTSRDLGVIYQTIHRDSDAVAVFREGLKWMEKGIDNPTFEVMYIMDMLSSTLRLNLFQESEELLIRYEGTVDRLEHSYHTDGKIFPVQRHRWLIYIYYTDLYIRKDQMRRAKASLEKAARYVTDAPGSGYPAYLYDRVQAFYYKKTGAYEKALRAVNQALEGGEDTDRSEVLKMKVDILRSLKRYDEALVLYKKILALNASVKEKAFNRQISQLRALHDLNGKEKQTRELAYQAEQLSVKQHLIVSFILLSLVLSALLYVLIRFYRRAHRLKNELLKEKNSLLESGKRLRAATEKAERANQKKTAFIASISHEVRTPLNAIVGFSELLLDDTHTEDEKKEFAAIVNNSSELLLNLVNDVLDLARLESGRSQFVLEPTDLVVCCRKALESIEHRIQPGVRLTFAPPSSTYYLYTDGLRIEQLLVNLLTNAAKFTRKGEINLDFRVEASRRRVVLSVTDTGCGIPSGMEEKIFGRFEKLDEFMQGTGLGLSICRIIAERLNGSVFVDASYKGGARFIFIHPIE